MRRLAIALAVTVALVAAAGIILAAEPSTTTVVGRTARAAGAAAEATARRNAINACHKAVQLQLKSPGSARWAGDTVGLDGDGYYTVTGHVDAQNGFGALVRLSYRCGRSETHDGVAADVIEGNDPPAA